jgi:hypothetical protein
MMPGAPERMMKIGQSYCQVEGEPATLRLTAEPVVAGSRCKHKTYTREKQIIALIGGTLGGPHQRSSGASFQKRCLSSGADFSANRRFQPVGENRCLAVGTEFRDDARSNLSAATSAPFGLDFWD